MPCPSKTLTQNHFAQFDMSRALAALSWEQLARLAPDEPLARLEQPELSQHAHHRPVAREEALRRVDVVLFARHLRARGAC